MFRCESCTNLSQPGEKSFRMVTDWRVVEYRKSAEKVEFGESAGSFGVEPSREKTLCKPCADTVPPKPEAIDWQSASKTIHLPQKKKWREKEERSA
jgi:hypothetical protein